MKMNRTVHLTWAAGFLVFVLSLCAHAQAAQAKSSAGTLLGMDTALEELSAKASPAVVHIEVLSYGTSADEDDEIKNQTLAKRRGSGSGVIVDPDGYIITAFHVVKGARRIRVELDSGVRADTPSGQRFKGNTRSSLEASVVGVFRAADVAVLKSRDIDVAEDVADE